ncbi:hypothetical protein IJE86_00840 [bacterium]|nr:hypothetical protein [bacterium]
MKKLFLLLIVTIFFICDIASNSTQAAKKTTKKSAISAAQIKEMSETVDYLTTKIYAGSLFSPEDNSKLIQIKIKLDNQMLIASDASLAPLYYKAGNLYKAREYKSEAIDCYQTILENFGDTALAPKALKELNSLGVKVNLPQTPTVTE